jgi:D-alanine-D-alanine ligase
MPEYSVVPIYVTRDGRWLTGDALFQLDRFKNAEQLGRDCTPVILRPMAKGSTVSAIRKRLGQPRAMPIDVVFPLIHGPNGEDGTLQGALETLGLPYVGSGILASALGMNKIAMKQMFALAGLPQVPYALIRGAHWRANGQAELAKVDELTDGPVFVKPVHGGSSIGVTFVRTRDALAPAIELALQFDEEAIVEAAVLDAVDVNCAVLRLGDAMETSALESIRTADSFLSYEEKYVQWGKAKPSKGIGGHAIPASLPDGITQQVKALAKTAFEACYCDGVARIDFLLRGDDIYVSEVNTMPGSLAFYLWEASGMPFDRMLDLLLRSAIARWEARRSLTFSLDRNLLAEIDKQKNAAKRVGA